MRASLIVCPSGNLTETDVRKERPAVLEPGDGSGGAAAAG